MFINEPGGIPQPLFFLDLLRRFSQAEEPQAVPLLSPPAT